MGPGRIQGCGSVAIRMITRSSSFSKCNASHSGSCRTPVWMGKVLTCVCFKRKASCSHVCNNLSPLQEERLRRLRHRTNVYFDESMPEHQEALSALWSATFPGKFLISVTMWNGKGKNHLQTSDRRAGFISLENLLFFAKTFSTSFLSLIKKQTGKRAVRVYPFAVAGVNITFMLMQMLDLNSTKPGTFIRAIFLQMLAENEWAFDLLYCVAFVIMDKLWLEKNATYMDFNDILKSTRYQLEKELMLDDVTCVEDMPSYSLLH